ncbi:hypothetical protein BZA77DRAFT_165879 [Pyronema omphalodes]|nr:hypothetical protein BZA77DRAFT_165879 [Pyronema omphalodes]
MTAFVSFYITEFAASIYGDPRRNPHINWDGYESSASAICHRFRENLRFRNYRARRRYSLHKGTPNREVSGHLSDGPPGRDFYPGSQNLEAHSMPSSRRVKTSFQGQPVVLNISSHNNTSQPRRFQQSATTIHPTPPARNTPQQQEAQRIRNEFCKSIGSAAVNGQPKISPQRFGMASDTKISTDEDTEEEDNRTERADSPEPIYVGHRVNSRSLSQILSPKQPSQATASKKSTNNAVPPSPPISRLSYSRSLSPRESISEPPSQSISPEPTTSTGPSRGFTQSAKQSVPFSIPTIPPPQTHPTSIISDRTIMPPPPPPPPRGRMPSTASRGSRTPSTHSRIPRSASRSKTASVTETPVKKSVATPKPQVTPRTPRNAVRASSPPASRTRSAMRRR